MADTTKRSSGSRSRSGSKSSGTKRSGSSRSAATSKRSGSSRTAATSNRSASSRSASSRSNSRARRSSSGGGSRGATSGSGNGVVDTVTGTVGSVTDTVGTAASKAKAPLFAGGAAAAGLVGGIVLGSRVLTPRKKVLGIPVARKGLNLKPVAKEIGRLTDEVSQARKQAKKVGDALS
jgi:hypothetical protein